MTIVEMTWPCKVPGCLRRARQNRGYVAYLCEEHAAVKKAEQGALIARGLETARTVSAIGSPLPDPRVIGTVRAADIHPTRLPMLWRRRIPADTLCVIAGKPGLGKSTLSALIAAELSQRGLAVILSNVEDDLSSVLRPRLEVAGADLERVHVVPPSAAPLLPRDFGALEALIREAEASCLILDPVAAHFRPEGRVHDREALRTLLQIAREARCTIIGIHHTTKVSIDGTALGAIGGPSGGLAGSARAVFLYGHDPDDRDRRALGCVKINGVDLPPALVMEHETIAYRGPRSHRVEAGRLSIVGDRVLDSQKLLRPGKSDRQRDALCAEWLTHYLAASEDCRRETSEILRDGGAAGFSWQTLLRASTVLKLGSGAGSWRLPAKHPMRQPNEAGDGS